jgi:hypothetical protein
VWRNCRRPYRASPKRVVAAMPASRSLGWVSTSAMRTSDAHRGGSAKCSILQVCAHICVLLVIGGAQDF